MKPALAIIALAAVAALTVGYSFLMAWIDIQEDIRDGFPDRYRERDGQ